MRLPAGLELSEHHEGFGKLAERGDRVTYNVRIFLNRGDEVPLNETHALAPNAVLTVEIWMRDVKRGT